MEYRIFLGLLLLAVVRHTRGISICPTREISATQGEVTSPSHPSNYPSNADCSLTIDGGQSTKFTVKFIAFDVEEDEDDPNECKYDVFTIVDGSRTLKYCGSGIPEDFVSTGNKIILGFNSDDSLEETGFKVTFTTENVAGDKPTGMSVCPTKEIKVNSPETMTGAFHSPNFPDVYPDNQKCSITLDVPDNYKTVIWFQKFALQYSSTCNKDQLVLSDELDSSTQCGGSANQLPPPLELKGRKVKIAFSSDATNTASGFQLRYNVTRIQKGRCICSDGLSYFTVTDYKKKIKRQEDDISFEFKSTQSSGMIMYAKGSHRDYIHVGYKDSRVLMYHIDLGTGERKVQTTNLRLNDNQWHKVQLSRSNRFLTITIDDGRASAVGQTPGGFNRLDIPDATAYFLGAPSSMDLDLPNFLGCIRDLTVDGIEPITNAMVGKPSYAEQPRKDSVRQCSPSDQQ